MFIRQTLENKAKYGTQTTVPKTEYCKSNNEKA